MKDPFPLAPPPALINLTKPLADALSLPTLPLHIHEVLFAFALYTWIGAVASPLLSRYFVPEKYNNLNKRTRINWDVHVVSFFQSIIVCAMSLYVMYADKERSEIAPREHWEERVWEYTGLSGMLQSFALGYFLWDFIQCSWHLDIFGWGMLAHAISALSVFALGYRPFIYFYAPIFLMYELSSPFLNIHWFCDKLNLTGSIYQAVNGAFLTGTFFACRIIYGNISSVYVFNDVFRGFYYGNSSLRLAEGGGMKPGAGATGAGVTAVPGRTYTTADLLQIYGDEQGQRYAFVGETHVPLILALTYLASNIVLNTLNIYWFAKMVQTIRSRFDPPIGTKGTSAKEIHYERPEKVEEKIEKEVHNDAREAIERAKREGRAAYAASPMKQGSLRTSREHTGTPLGDVPVAVDAAADLQQAIPDVNSSVEIEGKRTLRTRRKA